MATERTVIEARGISRHFRSAKQGHGKDSLLTLFFKPEFTTHEALKNVSFSIKKGEFVGLIGANGAGKTTLLKILSGLIPPTKGEASVLGYEPFKRTLSFRRQISLVMGQKAQLWWDLPALDAFELLKAIYEIPTPEYNQRLKLLTELLDVGGHLKTQIRRLSLGERMKMELIGAIIHWPAVIFLDEPTIGLDVLAAYKLREFLREFNKREEATIILTSHNMDDIERLCPRMLILKSGEMIYDGPPSRLTAGGERRLKIRLLERPSTDELSSVTGLPGKSIIAQAEGDESEEPSLHFALKQEQIAPVMQALLAKYRVVDMAIEEQSLERVIQRLYEGGA
jgi:ABC-2 type transport system ATP-binding protein